ncbi:hypothetical protein SD70_02570 [Gordoniibacillus kamchatkensis]|uniref:LysM domain-containing protein n=1 Tax=Gordoniibacillus kamchatkensis TaxID=1590651 RepID=A0ABR5AP04_9BACL|nr:hypothetical protein [Paenibacillus sp. VKM B-2647]KIL42087.1 hypothetical protein SD70_02570 [Paenibacillus sp. VKM B-2647]
MKLSTYTVAQGDTLEVVSTKLLGSRDRVSELIQINRLRYPYISDNPIDQFARPKGNVFLTEKVSAPTSLRINNSNSIVIAPNDTVFLLQGDDYGSAIVEAVNGNTIVLSSAIQGNFDQSAIAIIYANQENVTTQVLRTGDTLLYPVNSQQNSGMNTLVFGTDWRLDDNGFLQKQDGDISTISGADNLTQALKMRFKTPLGALNLHPDYGNSLFSILGEAGAPYFKSLASHYLEQCALQDIRVQSAKISEFIITPEAFFATATIVPVGSQDPINQPITIPIGGR